MKYHEFLKGGVGFISATGTPAGEINATFSLVLCDLRDLSEAGVKTLCIFLRQVYVSRYTQSRNNNGHFKCCYKFVLRPEGWFCFVKTGFRLLYYGTMNLQRGIFVTGTDTGVGKTFVAAGMLAAFREAGRNVAPMKPVQTGCRLRQGLLVAPDLMAALKAGGMRVAAADRADMAPYCFRPACSPHLAARLAGQRISLNHIEQAYLRLSRSYDGVIVEGAGGILVPLNAKETMLDLMLRLKLPVLLVARAGLGTINQTLLSLRILNEAKLPVVGVVLNQVTPGRWGQIEEDNRHTIERMGQVTVLACLRHKR
jgi:dethiobiotin synthetase